MTHPTNAWMLVIGIALQGVGVFGFVLGTFNLFRTVVMDFQGQLSGKEGTSFARIASATLGFATVAFLAGRALESIAR